MAKKSNKSDKPDGIYPIFVLSGPDRRRLIDQSHYISDMVVGDDDPQLAVSNYDGEKAEFPDVIDDLQTLPFLSQYRLVVISDADKFITANREKLEAYLDKPSATGILLMTVKTFPGNTRLAKKAAKVGWVYKYEELKPAELPKFVTEYARSEYKLGIKSDAVKLLIGLTGDSSGELVNEIDKIAAYLVGSGSKEITCHEIELLVGNNRQYDAFNVIDAISKGEPSRALELLDQILSKSRDAEYGLVGAFAWYFRKLYSGRVMYSNRVSPREIPRSVGIWHNQDAFLKLVSSMSGRDVAMALQRLADIDHATKTGSGTVKSGLEKFIVEFCRK